MKRVISFFLLVFSFSGFCCEFIKSTPIISLSGPITYLLKELNLLKPPVVGISEFHGIDSLQFAGIIFKGGLFLSPQTLSSLDKPLVFFDESLEQRKTMKKLALESVEVISKNKDPFETYEISKKKLAPYLNQCEYQLRQLQDKVLKIKNRIQNGKKRTPFYFFYLGEIKKDQRKPNLIMVDGFVLTLKKLGIINTYPSDLNYIPWSEKLIHEYEKKNLYSIGLVTASPKNNYLDLKKVGEREYNFYHPALLVPGLAQINFLEELMEKLP